ncbi:hypothetical protein M9H77_05557 [Catharanthus roseus]|uniref:Uncharacterized protein n=1 Tax=Catharanthus roseus TaxID=4058 RepID=A0ACC0CHP0_CATRO|nr:hypothetical protein M9H77_05557 [Catharanthus roseus]
MDDLEIEEWTGAGDIFIGLAADQYLRNKTVQKTLGFALPIGHHHSFQLFSSPQDMKVRIVQQTKLILTHQILGCLIALLLTGLPTSDDDTENRHATKIVMEGHLSGAGNAESVNIQHNTVSIDGDPTHCALKCKSVYKCRLCPRIVCLSEETLRAHLKSKRHARSEKLLKEGRLKLMLNDDGKIEGDMPEKMQAPVEDNAPHTANKKGKKRHRLSKRWMKREELLFCVNFRKRAHKQPFRGRIQPNRDLQMAVDSNMLFCCFENTNYK